MKKSDIYIAILAGGKGERLWPKSRIKLPKQNLRIFSKNTFLQSALARARRIAPRNIFIITGEDSLPYTRKDLKKSAVKRIVAEPFGRNTAPAVGLATLVAYRENKDSILIAMPSDAIIGNEKRFVRAIKTAIRAAARQNAIVTLGIKPTSIETAYGYIGIEKKSLEKGAYKVERFIEKPNSRKAKKLIRSGKHFWNSGIFIFRTQLMLSMLKRHTPALYRGLMKLPRIKDKKKFARGVKNLYKKLKSESLDYAVLEKTRSIQMVPSNFRWSDLGSFTSIARLAKKGKDGNIVFGNHVGIDTKKSLIFSDAKHLVGTVGVKDIIVVVTPDAVLVSDRKRAEDIKKLVGKIKKKKKLVKFL